MRIQIVGHNGKGRGSRVITRLTRGDYSHGSVRILDIPIAIRHAAFTRYGYEITEDHEVESIQFKGVHHQPFKPSNNQTWFNFPHNEDDAEAIFWWLLSKVGCGYDWSGIGGFVTRRDWEDPDKYFCSELAADALLVRDIRLQWLPSYKLSPTFMCASPTLWVAPDSPIKPKGR